MASTPSKYSPSETRLLALLPAGGERISTDELTRQFYGRRERPYNARIVISNLVRALERKTKLMRAPVRLRRTKQSGPQPIQVWLEQA